MKSRFVLAAIAILIAVGAGWYFGSPRWTLYQMKAAAEAGDVEKLASYIDFPKLRSSLKEELKANAAAQLQKAKGMEALGAMLAINMVDGLVDGMVTPSVLRKVFVRDKRSGPEGMTAVDATANDVVIDRSTFDRFVLRSPNAGTGALIFDRSGLGWKLTGIRMGDDNASSVPAKEQSPVGTPPASASEEAPAQAAEQFLPEPMADAVDEPIVERQAEISRRKNRPTARVSPGLDPEEVAADAVTGEVNARRAQDVPQE